MLRTENIAEEREGWTGTMNPDETQSYATLPPVVPFPEFLPLDNPNLPWDRFEAFCEELISRLPGVKETHRYGRRGIDQKGIDIFADLDTGERWAFQCKQWQNFAKTDATNAIQNTSYSADRYILMLSRQATSTTTTALGWGLHPALTAGGVTSLVGAARPLVA